MKGSNGDLLQRFCALDAFAIRGFLFERLDGGDILIHRNGHAYGVWQTRVNGYRYIPAGRRAATHVAASRDEVLQITMQVLSRP